MSKKLNMRKILLTSFENIKKILLALTLMLVINFVASDQVELVAAMLIGYVLAGFYIVSTAARLENLVRQKTQSSKRQTLFGLALRLLMLFVVFAVAIKISQRVFFVAVIGFLTFYLLMQLGLVMHSYKSNYGDSDDVDKK